MLVHVVVGRVLERGDEGGRYSALWKLARSKHIPIQIAHTIQQDLDRENRGVRILHPHNWTVSTSDRCNEESVVLEIQIDHQKVLLSGDIEEDAERHLLKELEDVDVLKVAHHGSRSSSRHCSNLVKARVECYNSRRKQQVWSSTS